ncbi:peroxisomal targeting signal 2 receptor [Rhizina undulata]
MFFGGSTNGQWLILLGYLGVNALICAWPMRKELQSLQLARRTGWMSAVNCGLMLVFAMKNTPLAKITGYSYEKLNVFHRWVSLTAFALAVIHTVSVTLTTYRVVPPQTYILLSAENILGMVSMAVWAVMMFSFYVLRKRFYEYFYFLHITLFPAMFVTLMLHNRYAVAPVIAALGVYAIDRAIRQGRWFLHNRNAKKFKAKIEETSDGMVKIKVPRPAANFHWRPGNHVFLRIPEISRFQSHPFTIASVDDGEAEKAQKWLEFLVKPQRGFTKKLHELVADQDQDESEFNFQDDTGEKKELEVETRKKIELVVHIDGPYGSVPDFNTFDRVVLFATGSGITFIMPIALDLKRKGKVKRVDFIWAVQQKSSLESMRDELLEIGSFIDEDEEGTEVRIRLQVTRERPMKKAQSMLERLLGWRRPDELEAQLRKGLKKSMMQSMPNFVQGRTAMFQSTRTFLDPSLPDSSNAYLAGSAAPTPINTPSQSPIKAALSPSPYGYPLAPYRNSHQPSSYSSPALLPQFEHFPSTPATSATPADGAPPPPPPVYMPPYMLPPTPIPGVKFRPSSSPSAFSSFSYRERDVLEEWMFYGRPDVSGVIEGVVAECEREETIGIGVCGVGAFVREVRGAVAHEMKGRYGSFTIVCEEFALRKSKKKMFHYRTEGFNGYSVKYSPFYDSRLACAASANFGLVGNGRVYILALTPNGIVAEKWFDTQDSLYDVSFSEIHENQLVVASGDGSIKLFDISLNDYPIQSWQEHKREVFSVSWNLVDKTNFVSSSWDGTVKIWSPHHPHSLQTIPINSCTYSTSLSPHIPHLLSTVSSDSYLRVFDLRIPNAQKPTILLPVSPQAPAEILTHDWNKYRPDVIATGGVDRIIRTFDLRNPAAPVTEMIGHEYAIRRLSWSPHWADVLISASYDMTVRVWTDGSQAPSGGSGIVGGRIGRMLGVMDRHTEFCAGVDWCLFGGEGWAASTGWDESVWVWDVGGIIGSG